MEPAGGFFRGGPVTGKDGQKILHHHFAAPPLKSPIKLGHNHGKSLHQPGRQDAHDDQSEPPQTGAIEGKWVDG